MIDSDYNLQRIRLKKLGIIKKNNFTVTEMLPCTKKGIYYFLFSDVDLSGFTGIKCKFSVSVWINSFFSLCICCEHTLYVEVDCALGGVEHLFFFFFFSFCMK